MAVKLADTLKPMADFPAAMAEDINIVQANNTQKSLQKMYEDGELGGGGGLIDDTTQSSDTTYSSYKIEEKVAGMINDTATESETTTYSAKKINSEISSLITADEGIRNTVGDITSLSTTDKSSVVAAINETNVNLGELSDSLVDKQDFRIFKSLEEFNEKKGTSFTVVSGVDNMVDIANAMSEGDMLIITTKYTSGSEIYFGLDSSTGWTKMFTLTRIGGLCDIKCTTSAEKNLTRVLAGSTLTAWQELATMDKVADVVKLLSISIKNTDYSNGMNLSSRLVIPSGYKFLCWTTIASDNWIMTKPIYFANPTERGGFPFTSEAPPSTGAVSFYYQVIKS